MNYQKKLIKMTRKWQKMAALRRGIALPKTSRPEAKAYDSSTMSYLPSFMVGKGCFVVYTTDDVRFAMPLPYLNHTLLKKLFNMSEEEFGLSSDRPIRLPCDSIFLGYVVTLIQRGVTKELEKALIHSMDNNRCSSLISSSYYQELENQALLACG